jgi:hypothetical protein
MGFRDDDRCSCPHGPKETPHHLLFSCPKYSKDRLAAAKSSRISLHTTAFLYRDIAHKTLAELLRNTRIGTRMDRAEKEQERQGRDRGGFDGQVDGLQWDGEEDHGGEDDEDDDFDVMETELSEEEMADADDWLHGEFWERVEAELGDE